MGLKLELTWVNDISRSAFGRVAQNRGLPTRGPIPTFSPSKILMWAFVAQLEITKQGQPIAGYTRARVGHVLCDDEHRAMPTKRHRGVHYGAVGAYKQLRVACLCSWYWLVLLMIGECSAYFCP